MVIVLPWGRCCVCNTFFYLKCIVRCFLKPLCYFLFFDVRAAACGWMHIAPKVPFCRKFKEINVFLFFHHCCCNARVVQDYMLLLYVTHQVCHMLLFATAAVTSWWWRHISASDLNCLMTDTTDIKVLKALRKQIYDLNCVFIFQAGFFGKGQR